MVFVFLAMLSIMAMACLIVVYVAYPHRGQRVPGASWVGDLLRKGVDTLPARIDETEEIYR